MNRTLEMKVNLNVLEHLGMNLYSNVPAVLSEIVANSWDADATKVAINIDKKTIEIQDNGTGMSRDDVIDRFLMIGFQRRSKQHVSNFDRDPMGRKGIGKLSSFSIANKVTVYTKSGTKNTAFCMDAKKIKEESKSDSVDMYKPSELNWSETSPPIQKTGTIVRLTDLKIGITSNTIEGMRKRLARRFTIIGAKHNFEVLINGKQIDASDRGYHKNVEFVWIYGNIGDEENSFTALAENGKENREIIENDKSDEISISGWIGTVRHSGLLKAESGENLNRIAIYMRGKLAQDDILREFGAKEIYADYIIGELHCEDLDRDDLDDIATSSRQALKGGDTRVNALVGFVGEELKHIRKNWSKLRGRVGTVEARSVPEVDSWFESLKGDERTKAERWVGRLSTIRSMNQRQKMELLKASILAFEIYRRKQQLSVLEEIEDRSVKQILEIFKNIDDLQVSYYGQIVSLRLGVIKKLTEILDDDAKEKEIQEFLFENLWLLDPSWERVKGTEAMESGVSNWLKKSTAQLSEEERKARIDIGYRRASGQHVVIELKRKSASINLGQLINQICVYRNGVLKKVEEMNQIYAKWPIEIICVVGKRPKEWHERSGPERVQGALKALDARLIFYDEVLTNAKNAYGDYLKLHEKIDPLWKIFKGIDNFTIDSDEVAH